MILRSEERRCVIGRPLDVEQPYDRQRDEGHDPAPRREQLVSRELLSDCPRHQGDQNGNCDIIVLGHNTATPTDWHRSGSNWQTGSGQNSARDASGHVPLSEPCPPQSGHGNSIVKCPLWVKSRHRKGSTECPLYPQKRTLKLEEPGMGRLMSRLCTMTALPPKADIGTQPCDVRFVPKADITGLTR